MYRKLKFAKNAFFIDSGELVLCWNDILMCDFFTFMEYCIELSAKIEEERGRKSSQRLTKDWLFFAYISYKLLKVRKERERKNLKDSSILTQIVDYENFYSMEIVGEGKILA